MVLNRFIFGILSHRNPRDSSAAISQVTPKENVFTLQPYVLIFCPLLLDIWYFALNSILTCILPLLESVPGGLGNCGLTTPDKPLV